MAETGVNFVHRLLSPCPNSEIMIFRVAGRLTAIVWMLAGAGLFTYITATITSAMTVETLNSDIQSVADLKARKWPVGTVAGSTAQLSWRPRD